MMHSLSDQSQQGGRLGVFIYISDFVCKTGEKIVRKTWGKTEYFSQKVGHVMSFNIQTLYSCILVHLQSSPMKKYIF